MRCLKLICIVLAFPFNVFSQEVHETTTSREQQLENLTDNQEIETEDDSYLQSLLYFRKNKIDVNTAGVSELRELKILSDLQVQNLLRYRKLLGNFLSIYELQAIPTWDIETIRLVLPYLEIRDGLPLDKEVLQRFSGGQYTVLAKVQEVVERSEGFERADSISNRYLGSTQKMLLRYKYNFRNLLQYGITAEKDAGEQFFKGKQKNGFDFYSFHLFARKLGAVKALAVGDFTVNMGQGLIQWQSLAFKKSADVAAVKRQADILRPYNSAGEYLFHRGAGMTVAKNNLEFTIFASFRNLDANLNTDTGSNNQDFISSILTTGYHRTPNEILKRNGVNQNSFGGNISYNAAGFHLGFNAIEYHFSEPIQRNREPYNIYAIKGNTWHNYSADYSFTYRNMHFFGEAAVDKNQSKALLNGLLISLDRHVDASIVYRNIEPSYQSLFANAFTESTLPTNEKGLFTGVSVRPHSQLKLDLYADVYRFPWLRYRVDAPSGGSDYFVQLTYKPSKQVEIYTRYRYENKEVNLVGLSLPARQTVNRPREGWRTHFTYKVSPAVTLKNRVELIWFDQLVKERQEEGFLMYFAAAWAPFGKPFSVNGRIQFFETNGFNSRIYAYENDLLYSFSIPVFIDKGVRYYLNASYDVSKKLTVWARWAQSIYADKRSIGNGLDEINGPIKSDFKLQFLYSF